MVVPFLSIVSLEAVNDMLVLVFRDPSDLLELIVARNGSVEWVHLRNPGGSFMKFDKAQDTST